jgi:hypothetical protein
MDERRTVRATIECDKHGWIEALERGWENEAWSKLSGSSLYAPGFKLRAITAIHLDVVGNSRVLTMMFATMSAKESDESRRFLRPAGRNIGRRRLRLD